MHNLEKETYHLWRTDLDGIVRKAIRQRSAVIVQSHLPLDECNTADVILTGRFLDITGHQAQFVVEDFDLRPSNGFLSSPECEYSFAVNVNDKDGSWAKVEYGGRAIILDQELQKNNLPEGLLLRISQPARIRHMRRHERFDCPDQLFTMPGLMLIDDAPTSRRKLLSLLAQYYQQKSRPRPLLVDMSAGGVCLKSDDPRCHRFMGAEERYLFFFFSRANGKAAYPHVFVGKKVGIFRASDSRHAGLRIRFMRELVWDEWEDELKWADIDAEGSETLRKLLVEWNNANSGE